MHKAHASFQNKAQIKQHSHNEANKSLPELFSVLAGLGECCGRCSTSPWPAQLGEGAPWASFARREGGWVPGATPGTL